MFWCVLRKWQAYVKNTSLVPGSVGTEFGIGKCVGECHVSVGKVLTITVYVITSTFMCTLYVLLFHCVRILSTLGRLSTDRLTAISSTQICTHTAEYGDGLHPPQPEIKHQPRFSGYSAPNKHSLTKQVKVNATFQKTEVVGEAGARKVLGTVYSQSFTVDPKEAWFPSRN